MNLNTLEEIDALTAQDYISALQKIKPTKNEWEMLYTHMRTPNHTISMRELAQKVGFSNWNAANLHYGKLATKLCIELKKFPETKLAILADFSKPREFEWQLQLRPNALAALKQLDAMAHPADQNEWEMDHFIAYHSVKKMGYELKPSGTLQFFSKKEPLLRRAIGNTVWVIQGSPRGNKTAYSLVGAYIAEHIEIEDPSSKLYAILGKSIHEFSPPLPLNHLEWLPVLLKQQSNFSLGFNRVNDQAVINTLKKLLPKPSQSPPPPSTLYDPDLPFFATEGSQKLVSHLTRERDKKIVDLKKQTTLATKGHLSCEVCNFNFARTYGHLGDNFCEVHHLVPLSSLKDETVATALDDLAIVCSNCHRIIHRSTPPLTLQDLIKAFNNNQ